MSEPERKTVEIEYMRFRQTDKGLEPQPCKGVLSVPVDWTPEQIQERVREVQRLVGEAIEDERGPAPPEELEDLMRALLSPGDEEAG
jgi:hypothetical protein